MHYVSTTTVDIGRQSHAIEVRSDDDEELPGQSHIAMFEGEEALSKVPSEDYPIFDEGASTAAPMVTNSYVSSADLRRSGPSPSSILKYVVKNWSSILMIFVPVGIVAPRLGCSDSTVFVLNCLAIVPLADVLCRATDELSTSLGETTGALLNVTMGNATEVVIFHALLQRQLMIVRTSLLGSVIVNILLVLGLAIITGECYQRGQTYNIFATRLSAGLLCLTTVSLLVPSTLHTSDDNTKLARNVLTLSRGISIVLIFVYIVYLATQIRSTSAAYKPLIQLDPDSDKSGMIEISEIPRHSYHRRTLSYPRTPEIIVTFDDLLVYNPTTDSGFTASAPTRLSSLKTLLRSIPWAGKTLPVIVLVISTGLISICGGYLVDSIDHFVDHSPISKTMVGLIILPIVGNAAELVSGIMFASRKQMDLAFAVSIGSAIQIALFVTPLMVIVGWGLGRDMALHFTVFEAVTLVASTVLLGCLILDDKCNALKGVSLFAGYAIIGLASWFVPNVG